MWDMESYPCIMDILVLGGGFSVRGHKGSANKLKSEVVP